MKELQNKRNVVLRVLFTLVVVLLGNVAMNAAVGDVFVPITDGAMLKKGDKVIVVCRDYKTGLTAYKKGSRLKGCSVRFDTEEQTVEAVNDSLCIFTLQTVGDAWAMATDDGNWLVVRLSSYDLSIGNDLRNHQNKQKMSFQPNGDCVVEYKEGFYLRCGNRDFGCYSSKGSVRPVQIYRKLNTPVVYDELTLSEQGGNTALLSDKRDARVRTLIIDRTFSADGGYYTMCIPVALNQDDIQTAFGGAAFYAFESATAEDDKAKDDDDDKADKNVVFRFNRVYSTEAGKPYILKPNEANGEDIIAPRLHKKIVYTDVGMTVEKSTDNGKYSFVGAFDPTMLPANGSVRFVGSSGLRLVTPNKQGELLGMRCYFRLPSAAPSVGFEASSPGVNYSIVLDDTPSNSNGSQTTAIHHADKPVSSSHGTIYNLCGQRMNIGIDMLPRGIYIVDGKKIVKD